MTNGDWIRSMTDEELAESNEVCAECYGMHCEMHCDDYKTCDECTLAWLKKERKISND